MHELTHAIAAIMTGGRVVGFSLIPKMIRDKKGRITANEFGSILYISRFSVFDFIVGLAPLSLWVLLWFILVHFEIIFPYENSFSVDFKRLFDPSLIWIWFISIQLLWSGVPSSVDIKQSIRGFFSLSGLFCMTLLVIYFQYSDQIDPYMYQFLGHVEDILVQSWSSFQIFLRNSF